MVFPANMMCPANVAMRVPNLRSLCCVVVVVVVVEFYFILMNIIAVVGYPPHSRTAAEWH
jgi:hypothetical protein